MNDQQAKIKIVTRSAYDLQKLRVQVVLRVIQNFKVKLGQKPSTTEEDLDAESKKILERLREDYKSITAGVTGYKVRSTFRGDGIITDFADLSLCKQYFDLEKIEREQFEVLGKLLRGFPLWEEFLKDIKGVGPAMAGILISEIDIHKARVPSSLWKYAGLAVMEDGKGQSRKKEHLVDVKYTNKKGEESVRKGITFNPILKTKLIGVLGSSFLRAGDNKYSLIYRDYKHRLENHPVHAEKTKGHRHNMATRYAVKAFLVDLHAAWRKLEGYEPSVPYAEAKLNIVHGASEPPDIK